MTEQEQLLQSELEGLKARADVLGIKYHSSISAERLRERINAITEQSKAENATQIMDDDFINEQRKKASELIRVRIACMNPNKSSWDGEIITVGNSVVGTLTKFIPFNLGENAWHVPRIILNYLEDRKYQVFYVETVNGKKVRRSKLVKEFNIEYLPPLTEKELEQLARVQKLSEKESLNSLGQ